MSPRRGRVETVEFLAENSRDGWRRMSVLVLLFCPSVANSDIYLLFITKQSLASRRNWSSVWVWSQSMWIGSRDWRRITCRMWRSCTMQHWISFMTIIGISHHKKRCVFVCDHILWEYYREKDVGLAVLHQQRKCLYHQRVYPRPTFVWAWALEELADNIMKM